MPSLIQQDLTRRALILFDRRDRPLHGDDDPGVAAPAIVWREEPLVTELDGQVCIRTVRYNGQLMVIDHVPAEVCPGCGDVLLMPDTGHQIEPLLRSPPALRERFRSTSTRDAPRAEICAFPR